MEKDFSKSGQEILRNDTCPYFAGRKSILAIEPICWFCKYAGFDLKSDKLPERGTCCYPKEQNRKRRECLEKENTLFYHCGEHR